MKNLWLFVAKFLVFSLLLFLAWPLVAQRYLALLAWGAQLSLTLIDWKVEVVGVTQEFISLWVFHISKVVSVGADIIALNIIPFLSLLLSTSKIHWIQRARAFLVGMPVLYLVHVITFHFVLRMHVGSTRPVMFVKMFFEGVGLALVPFILWAAVTLQTFSIRKRFVL